MQRQPGSTEWSRNHTGFVDEVMDRISLMGRSSVIDGTSGLELERADKEGTGTYGRLDSTL